VFLLKKFATFSTKKVSQFAKEVHETFSKTSFCNLFVNSTSLEINEKSFIFYQPIAWLFSLVFIMRFLNLLMRPLLKASLTEKVWLIDFQTHQTQTRMFGCVLYLNIKNGM